MPVGWLVPAPARSAWTPRQLGLRHRRPLAVLAWDRARPVAPPWTRLLMQALARFRLSTWRPMPVPRRAVAQVLNQPVGWPLMQARARQEILARIRLSKWSLMGV